MRLYLLILLFAIFAVVIKTSAQDSILNRRTSFSADYILTKEALRTFFDTEDLNYAYNPRIIPNDTRVSVNAQNLNIKEIIDIIVNDSTIAVKVWEDQIILYKADRNNAVISAIVRGTVLFENNREPVSFASVIINGTNKGTSCNEQGEFDLEIEKKHFDDTVSITAVGYKKFVCPVNILIDQKDVIILLQDSVYQLDEFIAFSYNHIEPLFWKSKRKNNRSMLLTFSTLNMVNCTDYIGFLSEKLGIPKIRGNTSVWKNVSMANLDNIKVSLKYFPCEYCPIENAYSVTLDIRDKDKNLLETELRDELVALFQNILNKTIAEGVNISLLEERDGLMYEKGSKFPYSGGSYSFYPNGNLSFQGSFQDGMRSGIWDWYFDNNQLGKTVTYNNGRLNGEVVFWYADGSKKLQMSYLNGRKSGPLKYWYQNGVQRIDANYTNDKLDGTYLFWFENGDKAKQALYSDGKPITATEWNKRGKVVFQY